MTIERVEAETIQIMGIQDGRYGDNRESGCRGYTDNGDPHEGGMATIESGRTRGGDRRRRKKKRRKKKRRRTGGGGG